MGDSRKRIQIRRLPPVNSSDFIISFCTSKLFITYNIKIVESNYYA